MSDNYNIDLGSAARGAKEANDLGASVAANAERQLEQSQLIAQAIEKSKQARIQTQVEEAKFDAKTYLSEQGLMSKQQALAQLKIVLLKEHTPEAEVDQIMKTAQEMLPEAMDGRSLYQWWTALKNPAPVKGKEFIATADDVARGQLDSSGNPVIAGRGYLVIDEDNWRLSGRSQAEIDAENAVRRSSKSSPAETWKTIGNTADGKAIQENKLGQLRLADTAAIGGGPVVPKSSTLPTASTRASSEFAESILPHIQELRQMIEKADAKGYIGPLAARVYGEFLTGKVGSTGDKAADELLGEMRATDSLLRTGAMRVHFGARGGQQMYEHFSGMLNTGKQSAAVLNGALNAIQKFMEGYIESGKPGHKSPTPAATPPPAAVDEKDPAGLGI